MTTLRRPLGAHQPSPPELPDLLRTDIEYSGHAEGAKTIEGMLGVGAELLRDGEGWAVETFLRFGTHNSTHVDAPWHYNSTVAGERAQTIDELPLEWFHAPGVVLDFSAREDGDAIDAADVRRTSSRASATRSRRWTSSSCARAATPSTPSSTTWPAARA